MNTASFRGVPFLVVANAGRNGRDNAVHSYPQSDQNWVEDLGRSPRHYTVRGFLTGRDCITQKALLVNAIEQRGPGLLIHPHYGVLQVSVMSFEWREPDYARNRIDFNCEFIEYSNPVAGIISQLAGSVIGPLADTVADSAVGDFLKDTAPSFNLGMMDRAVSVAGAWGSIALLQGTGTVPIAALGKMSGLEMQNSLLTLASNRENLISVLHEIDPSLNMNGVIVKGS